MKKIYIFMFQTQFKTGKTIRMLTRNKYNHVCLSFEPNTKKLYSYSRYRYGEPLYAGFGIEDTDRYYGVDNMSDIKVYWYEVEDSHYERIQKAVDFYVENQSRTVYNFFDIVTYPFKKHIKLDLTHTCISFVLEMLERDDVHTIGQFEKSLPEGSVIYEGRLDVFEHGCPTKGDIDFYEKRSCRTAIGASLLTICSLCTIAVKKIVYMVMMLE